LNILVTNDDGVYADGLWAVVKELQHVGDVTVVAPDRDQSGTGTSVTLSRPLRMSQARSVTDGIKAYSVEGTPADSVILGLRSAIKDQVDLVVSGINEGPNLGNDVFISGTIGAALQGYFYGIPAIAVSVAAFEDIYFDVAARLVGLLARAFNNGVLPRKMLLNVNVPNLLCEEIEGIEITKLGERSYTDKISPGHDGKRQYYWIVRGVPEWSVSQGSDIWALEQNKISITPVLNSLDSSVDGFVKDLATELFSNR
jgi:5'-nucleotidase